jgi:hypothetical protein
METGVVGVQSRSGTVVVIRSWSNNYYVAARPL